MGRGRYTAGGVCIECMRSLFLHIRGDSVRSRWLATREASGFFFLFLFLLLDRLLGSGWALRRRGTSFLLRVRFPFLFSLEGVSFGDPVLEAQRRRWVFPFYTCRKVSSNNRVAWVSFRLCIGGG